MNNTTANSLKDLPHIIEKAKENAGVGDANNIAEILRLLREIHAAVTGAPKEAEERKPSAYGMRFKIHGFMVQGKNYIAEDFIDQLQAIGLDKGVDSINIALIKLAKEGKITRVRAGIYRLPDAQQEQE